MRNLISFLIIFLDKIWIQQYYIKILGEIG